VASALNRGIKEMKGEFFSWLSHDDAYYPIKIEVQMNEMRCRKAPVILFSDYDIMDKDSRFVQREFLDHVRPSLFRIALIARSPVNGCTCLIPKSCFETVGYFDESLKSTQDNDMWFRLSETFHFIHMRERLIKSRIHPSQGSLVMTTHSDESNAYYARSMKRLLESTPDKMQSIVFARLAVWLKIAGLDKLSSQAIDISKAGLSASFLVPGLWARAVTAYALLCNRRYMWGTLALGFRTRVLRRKVSRCFASAKKGAVRVS
jgi:glycosyltransferase involved in cell wall biosynthesis